jgi:DNA mismatch repair protein MutS2
VTRPAFPTGSEVVVRTLGNARGVIVEAGRGGQYRVRVGTVTSWCREEDLVEPSGSARPKAPRTRRRAASEESDIRAPARVRLIDLHGLRVDEAVTRMIDEMDRALRDGADRVEVVHGKGSGRVRGAVHRQLATMRVVASFEVDAGNAGVTRVYFR